MSITAEQMIEHLVNVECDTCRSVIAPKLRELTKPVDDAEVNQLLDEYIELNLSNYDEEDVSLLNGWGIDAVRAIERLARERQQLFDENQELKDSNADYIHAAVEQQAEIERLTKMLSLANSAANDLQDSVEHLSRENRELDNGCELANEIIPCIQTELAASKAEIERLKEALAGIAETDAEH